MRLTHFAVAIGVMMSVAALAVALSGHGTALETVDAGMSRVQTGPVPPPKLSPREFDDLRERGVLAEHPLYANLPQPEPVYESVLRVMPSRDAKGAAVKLQENLARTLNAARIEPPKARLGHFAWLDKKPFRLLGWGGTIGETEDVPGGVTVTLRVMPSFHYDGGSATSADYYFEKYAVVNGAIHFLGGADPPDAEAGIALTD
jgi:hypothetical protein